MNLRKAIAISLLSFGFMASPMTVAYAEQQTIEATGSYTMQDGTETISDAQEKARKEAMRLIVEKAGIYVESYSKTENLTLTDDQVRVIAGQIIKIEKDEVKPVIGTDGKSISYVCFMRAVVDTDKIDLQRAMEMRKTAEDNEQLKKSVGELQEENQSLRTQYEQAKDDNEKMRIQNELLSNEQALGTLYQDDFKGTAVLKDIREATADIDSIKKAYPGMPVQEFKKNIHPALVKAGWNLKSYNGNLAYARRLDETFEERLSFSVVKDTVTMGGIFFATPTKVAADKVYRIAFANLCKSLGQPTITYDEDTFSAEWKASKTKGKEKKLTLSEWKFGEEYVVRISKDMRNMQSVVHKQEQTQDVLLNLSKNDGDWYDDAGNKVLSIHNGTINSCPVIAGFDFAGGRGQHGTYRIQQAAGPRDITIERLREDTIRVDGKTVLHSNPEESYYESVNGIHLGMADAAVEQTLGTPDRKGAGATHRDTWYYDDAGIQIEFETGKVVQMRMLNNGNWFFGRSGLNYRNSLADFQEAYHLARLPHALTQEQRTEGMIGGVVKIAAGEYLWFDYYPDAITLSIYGN